MSNIFDYIGYRVFEYFNKKDETHSLSRTISFISILQITLLVPLFLVINSVTKIDLQEIVDYNRFKYYIGIALAIVLIMLNTYFFHKKFKGENLKILQDKYQWKHYPFSIWWIFLAPIFFVFIIPIIYGALNGTIHFPFLEK
jgi:hypothetical protein